jgi:hypothetical protein
LNQQRGHPAVGGVGVGEPCGERYPHASHGACQVQLPAVEPPVPAGLRPSGFGVDGGMCVAPPPPLCPSLVPHSSPGSESTLLSMATARPHLAHGSISAPPRSAPQATDPRGQGLGQGTKPPLESAPGREAPVLAQQSLRKEHISPGWALRAHREQFAYFMQAAEDHDHQCLEEESVLLDSRRAWSSG